MRDILLELIGTEGLKFLESIGATITEEPDTVAARLLWMGIHQIQLEIEEKLSSPNC